MAWNTEATKRHIPDTVVARFAVHGLDGITIEWAIGVARISKKRIYDYFGGKRDLFAHVLCGGLVKATQAMLVRSSTTEDVGEYAGRVYGYHLGYPESERLLRWEGLTFDTGSPDDEQRLGLHRDKTVVVEAGQRTGSTAEEIDIDHMILLVLSFAGQWSSVPQVARMLTDSDTDAERARRRELVVRAAHRIARPD